MPISVGDKLPGATLMKMGEDGPEAVALQDKIANRKVVLFAVPGAFTPTCHSAHVPSFIRAHDALKEKGVDEVICIAVNDPFVMQNWAEATGAAEAGITMLADAEGAFTRAIGMSFDAPPAGLLGRSQRYSMLVENGEVKILNQEDNPGVCETSAGEALLDAMG